MNHNYEFSWDQAYLVDRIGDYDIYNAQQSHFHRYYEIYYLISGENEYIVDGQKFHLFSDNLLFIPSDSFHEWFYPHGKIQQSKNLHFLPELLDETELKLVHQLFSAPMCIQNRYRLNLNAFFQTLINCSKLPDNLQKSAIKNLIIALLVQSGLLFSKNTSPPVTHHLSPPRGMDERILKIASYINDNVTQEITLKNLANNFAITKNYLSTMFHKVMGVPIKKYIIEKRLEYARQNLVAGSNLGEAAYNAGFNDYASFYRPHKPPPGLPAFVFFSPPPPPPMYTHKWVILTCRKHEYGSH
jgi:AraC-like DNA-binding protein